jgi:3-mercaptopyruvate sulfurtransferase SseA
VLNLKTKGIENAAAVLGGYDAMVQAGLQVETGKPQAVPAAVAKKVQPAQPAQPGQAAAKPSQPVSSTAAATSPVKTKRAKRRKAKTRHQHQLHSQL